MADRRPSIDVQISTGLPVDMEGELFTEKGLRHTRTCVFACVLGSKTGWGGG